MAYGGNYDYKLVEKELYSHLDNEKNIKIQIELTERDIAKLKHMKNRNLAGVSAPQDEMRIINFLISQIYFRD